MKRCRACLFSLALALGAHADVVQLSGGQSLSGRVAAYSDDSFELQRTNGASIKIPAKEVASIDFSKGAVPATVEWTGQTPVNGNIWLYARGALNFDDAKGQTTRIPLAKVTRVSFSDQSIPERAAPTPAPRPARTWTNPYANAPAVRIETISHGEQVDVSRHCVPGKITIVDFYADWCGPCRNAGPILEERVNKDPDLFLRKVNIVSWTSPVSKQYGIRSIPYIQVYDRRGQEVGHLAGFNMNALDTCLNQARQR